jgi:hypothetical protein
MSERDEALYWVRHYINYWSTVEPPAHVCDQAKQLLREVAYELSIAIELPVPENTENI